MTDYISRDVAVNGLAKIINESDMPDDWNKGMSAAMLALFRIPAADVQPVVLCENCQYCIIKDAFEYWCNGFCSPARLVCHDDFCSRGVKKDV